MAAKDAELLTTVKAATTYDSYGTSTKEWIFPLRPLHDFELDGEEAHYAPGHPRQWGDETHYLKFRDAIRDGKPETPFAGYYAAVSPDHKLLAIASTRERIVIYNIETQELCQLLDGAGPLIFRPLTNKVGVNAEGKLESSTPAYVLVCNTADEGMRHAIKNSIAFWELDEKGRRLDQNLDPEEPVDASSFAKQAIEAILPDLALKHEWTRDFVEASSLHADFAKALSDVASTHRRPHNVTFFDSEFGRYGSTSFSRDGSIFLYHKNNQRFGLGIHAINDPPCVVVMDLLKDKELYRLQAQTPAIWWSAISPDSKHIASITMEGLLQIYSVETGELLWTIAGTPNAFQVWSGAFSADSKHIARNLRHDVLVYEVGSGKCVASVSITGTDYAPCRSMAWHPDGQQIAFCGGMRAYVWRPFEGAQGKITQHFQSADDWESYVPRLMTVGWLDHGSLLHLNFLDGTNLIYDTQENTKELFMHPKGATTGWVENGFQADIKIFGVQEGYISVDHDGMARYWSSGIVARGSWWDSAAKKGEKQERRGKEKVPFPPTGKYVMVTKSSGDSKKEKHTKIGSKFSHS